MSKQTLESISESIQSKRNENFDSLTFPFKDLTLSEYDIREDRDIEKLKENILRDGQLQVITLSLNDGVYTVVNGRTRYLAIENIRKNKDTKDLFDTVKVEVYEDLTELEQNYLNAQINVSQNPLTAKEKVNFVIKYKDVLEFKALGKALGIGEKMLENYIETADQPEEVHKAFSPKSEGHGRSDIKVEELGKTVKVMKSAMSNKKKKVNTKLLIAIGEKSETLNMTRDTKRKAMPKIAKASVALAENPKIKKKFTVKEIVDIATKETTINGGSGGTGDKLPKNSSEKYKIVDNLLKVKYDFAVLLYAESLYRIDDNGNKVDSETKRIIDSVDEIIVVGNEIKKLTEAEEYAESLGKKFTYEYGDVIDTCVNLNSDDRKGFVYVNGAMLYAQRPEFLNYLKGKFPKSTVAMVVLDLLYGKSNVYAGDRTKEIITVYAGAKNFDEVMKIYKTRVKFLKVRKFASTPQEKYIVYV